MKYSEISKFLSDNHVHFLQITIAKEVTEQLTEIEKKISEDSFNHICSEVYSIMCEQHYPYEKVGQVVRSTLFEYHNRGELITKGRVILNKVLDYIRKARERYPEITDNMLYQNGTPAYDNSFNGTKANWSSNGSTNPFCVYYNDENKTCFARVFVNEKGSINGYIYPKKANGEMDFVYLEAEAFDKDEARYLATLLQLEADAKALYCAFVNEIDFDRELKDYESL